MSRDLLASRDPAARRVTYPHDGLGGVRREDELLVSDEQRGSGRAERPAERPTVVQQVARRAAHRLAALSRGRRRRGGRPRRQGALQTPVTGVEAVDVGQVRVGVGVGDQLGGRRWLDATAIVVGVRTSNGRRLDVFVGVRTSGRRRLDVFVVGVEENGRGRLDAAVIL